MSTPIRVVHRIAQAPAGLLEDIQAVRKLEGCLQAELYKTLSDTDEDHAVAFLFESEAAYVELVSALGEYPALRTTVMDGDSEIYRQEKYALADGRWVPESGFDGRLVWPAEGAVSIVIQGAYEPNASMRELTAVEIAETRREPGCEYYAWFENVELDNHLMLLEVWADQVIYDAHWFGRTKTADYRGDSGRAPATPERGEASREFYRQQAFEFQYGRMVPAQVSRYSESVVWTAR